METEPKKEERERREANIKYCRNFSYEALTKIWKNKKKTEKYVM